MHWCCGGRHEAQRVTNRIRCILSYSNTSCQLPELEGQPTRPVNCFREDHRFTGRNDIRWSFSGLLEGAQRTRHWPSQALGKTPCRQPRKPGLSKSLLDIYETRCLEIFSFYFNVLLSLVLCLDDSISSAHSWVTTTFSIIKVAQWLHYREKQQ
jgi:hypothetical protein